MNKQTIILIICVAVVSFFVGKYYQKEELKMTEEEIIEKTVNFTEEFLLQGTGLSASVIEHSKENGLIKMKMEIGQDLIEPYVTRDGKLFFPEAFNVEEIIAYSNEPEEDSSQEGEMERFINCLADNNFIIYGEEWCGFCTELVNQFGGYDIVDPIYVECTEEVDLCQEKGIQGYPTIHLEGERFPGTRNLSDFAQYTGCEAPNIN